MKLDKKIVTTFIMKSDTIAQLSMVNLKLFFNVHKKMIRKLVKFMFLASRVTVITHLECKNITLITTLNQNRCN